MDMCGSEVLMHGFACIRLTFLPAGLPVGNTSKAIRVKLYCCTVVLYHKRLYYCCSFVRLACTEEIPIWTHITGYSRWRKHDNLEAQTDMAFQTWVDHGHFVSEETYRALATTSTVATPKGSKVSHSWCTGVPKLQQSLRGRQRLNNNCCSTRDRIEGTPRFHRN